MNPQELERMANERVAAVVPLAQIGTEDVHHAAEGVDRWLRAISHGQATLERVAALAAPVAVPGNIMALLDVLGDLGALATGPAERDTVCLWASLGLDLVGLLAGPGGAARTALRPTLQLLRQELGCAAADVGEALLVKLAGHLNETLAGELDTFVSGAIELLPSLLDQGAAKLAELAQSLAGALTRLADGELAAVEPEAPAARHDPRQGYPNAFAAAFGALPGQVIAAERRATRALRQGGGFKGVVERSGARAALLERARSIERLGAEARVQLPAQAAPRTAGSIAFGLAVLKKAIAASRARRRPRLGVVNATHGTRHERERGDGQLESMQHQLPTQGEPSERPHCVLGANAPRVASHGSISYATGSETLAQTDFVLPGPMPIVWTRTYHSRLGAYDHGVLGARWTSPYTVRIDQAEDGALVYHGADGRAVSFPRLQGPSGPRPGGMHLEPVDKLLLARGADGALVLLHHLERVETFELDPADRRAGQPPPVLGRAVRYRLTVRRDHLGHETRLAYAHPGGQLSDIASGAAHVRTVLDAAGRIESLWEVRDDAPVRRLAQCRYAAQPDGSADLLEVRDEDDAVRRYAYLGATHLLARHSDRTGRGMSLQWQHPEGGEVPLSAANSARARAWHERADDGSHELTLVWNRHIRLTTVIDAHGGQTRHFCDIRGHPYRIVHPAVTSADGRVIAQQEWLLRDAAARVTHHLHADGREDRYAYDERGNLVRHTRADGSEVHFAHDAEDRLSGYRDPEGHDWRARYDGALPTERTDPLGQVTRYAYDSNGRLAQLTDAQGGIRRFACDAAGQLTAFTDCAGRTSRWTYDGRGRLSSATDALGQRTDCAYAGAHLCRIRHPDRSEEHFDHDAEGRLLRHVAPGLRETRYQYDPAGRLIRRTDPNGHHVGYRWDLLGRLVELRNENGRSHRFSHDPVGRLLAEVRVDGVRTEYHHTPETGVLLQKVEPDTLTQYEFDPLGRLTKRSAWAWDPETRRHDPQSGQTERFGYDGSGRLIEASNPWIRLQSWHDPAGNLCEEHQHWSIDAQGQPTEQVTSSVWRHRHDALGHRTHTTRPDGHTTAWLSYGAGHLHGLLLDGAEVLRWERDGLHREIRRVQSNQLAETRTFDGLGRLSGQRLDRADPFDAQQPRLAPLVGAGTHRRYHHDGAGQLTLVQESHRRDRLYAYDRAGRLTGAHTHLGHEAFCVDPAGNLLDPNPAGDAQPPRDGGVAMIADNRVRDFQGTHYAYDARGNVSCRRTAGQETHLDWDAFGRLREARTETRVTRFLYDPLGRRIAKRNEAVLLDHGQGGAAWHATESRRLDRELQARGLGTTLYGWEGERMAWERSSTDGRTLHHVYAPDSFVPLLQASSAGDITQAFLTRPPDVAAAYANEAGEYDIGRDPLYNGEYQPGLDPDGNAPQALERLHFYQCDHLGTPVWLTDEKGELAWRADHSAWGQAKVRRPGGEKTRGVDTRIRFQGQYEDLETGLHYNRHRYYDPVTGRYTQSDPIGLAGGVNTYLYANANPLMYVDPNGLWGAADLPSIPQPVLDFTTGVADAASLGLGPLARQWLDVDGGVDRCSKAYSAGEWASLGLGAGRMAYAGIAKVGAAATANGAAAMAFRNGLKRVMRGPLAGSSYRIKTYEDLMARYGSDAAIQAAAGRTNRAMNAVGADLSIGGAVGEATRGCP